MTDFVQFYQTYDEEARLQRHREEFVATTYLLDPLFPPRARILEIGAATGTYSLHWAGQGHRLVAVDAVAHHIGQLRAKLAGQPHLAIDPHLGDARDLSQFAGGNFDAVLCMGPVYHLNAKDVRTTLQGCLAALAPGGLLAVAYVNKFRGFQSHKYATEFVNYSPDELEALLAPYALGRLCHAPTDGPVLDDLIHLAQKGAPLADLHRWLNERPEVMSDESWPAKSVHGLYVGRK
ncbi:MAG: methyltransferase domain-containing protein [Candidatus Latescibacteria bacterium]|nr:methyltransferase domain-containing protein [Candidatus Latescibacterota bacterium]